MNDLLHLGDVENENFVLEVYQCQCGFHIGIDFTFLDQVGDVNIICPSCKEEIFIPSD